MNRTSFAFHRDPVWWGIFCMVLSAHLGIWCWAMKQPRSETLVSRQMVERVHLRTHVLSLSTQAQEVSPLREQLLTRQEPVVMTEPPLPLNPAPSPPKPTPPKPIQKVKKKTTSPTKKPKQAPLLQKTEPSSPTPPKKKHSPPSPPRDPEEEKNRAAEQALLSSAAATLSQLETIVAKEAPSPKTISSSLPQTIGDLKSQQASMEASANYISQVAWKLKKTLRFPEYGSVRVEITISKEGRVERVSVLASENTKNRAYVEATIPNLSFALNPNHTAITYNFLLNNE